MCTSTCSCQHHLMPQHDASVCHRFPPPPAAPQADPALIIIKYLGPAAGVTDNFAVATRTGVQFETDINYYAGMFSECGGRLAGVLGARLRADGRGM